MVLEYEYDLIQAVLSAHGDWMRGVARRLTRDEHLAEDLVQDALLRLCQRPPEDRSDLRAWLGAVLRNIHISEIRASTSRQRREVDRFAESATQSESPLTELEQLEIHRDLVGAIATLHEDDRRLIELRYYECQTLRDLASTLGLTYGTARRRLAHAEGEVREAMGKEHAESWTQAALLPGVIGLSPVSRSVLEQTLTWMRETFGRLLRPRTIHLARAALVVGVTAIGIVVFGGERFSTGSDSGVRDRSNSALASAPESTNRLTGSELEAPSVAPRGKHNRARTAPSAGRARDPDSTHAAEAIHQSSGPITQAMARQWPRSITTIGLLRPIKVSRDNLHEPSKSVAWNWSKRVRATPLGSPYLVTILEPAGSDSIHMSVREPGESVVSFRANHTTSVVTWIIDTREAAMHR